MSEIDESTRRADRATVVICTRNRGAKIVDTVASVLASDQQDFELLIIDQSESDQTLLALGSFVDDQRVRYVRTTDIGVARSRSLALREARNEFVLNTDDDCVVDPAWIDANIRALRDNPRAGIVFGDVISPPDSTNGYAPESVADGSFTVRSIWSWKTTDGVNVGIGASMAMRRSVLLGLGGFDHRLGPGTMLRNAEDTDMTLRTLLAGHDVVRITDARVDHYGHRSHEEFRQLTRGAMFGLGAMCGKLLRRYPAATVWFGSGLVWRLVLQPAVAALIRLHKPLVLGRAVYLAKGFWVGVRIPLERSEHVLFAADGQAEA
jgi:GT2 family glycosyltransferase